MRLRKGQIVAVEFLDHCEGADAPIPFAVYGYLVSASRKSLTIDSWRYLDPVKPYDDNVKRFTIVRSAITRIAVLTEEAAHGRNCKPADTPRAS